MRSILGDGMRITIVGRGNIGGGLAKRWESAGHEVTTLGRQGGHASDAEVVVIAVPGDTIAEALGKVTGAGGKITIDATNSYSARTEGFPSLAHQVRSIIGGPTAKSFNLNFASTYDFIDGERIAPSNLFAADPGARPVTERLNRDAGFDPVFIGDLSMARLMEDQVGVLSAIAEGLGGSFFYRYARPGNL
jgi:predicted dinucleotide-binding enzyme